MATPRNKKKLAAINTDLHEDHPRNCQGRNKISPRIQEDYITEVLEKIGDRVTNCPRSSVGRRDRGLVKSRRLFSEPVSPVPLWTRSGDILDIGRKKTRERMRTAPRLILIMTWVSYLASPHRISAQ